MKTTFLYLPFLLLLFVLSCEDDDQPITPIPDPEPSSLSIGLLFHVPFSGNADDIGEGALSGVVTGATSTTDHNGEANEAYFFDGDDDVINYGSAPELALGARNTYTMTAWVKPEQRDDDVRRIVISKFNGGVAAGWYLGVNSDDKIQAYRNAAPWSVIGDAANSASEYVHIASSYDGSNFSVWRNGVLDSTIPYPGHPSDQATDVLIGGSFSQNNVNPSFKGTIDDVRIYNRVLTDDELTWLAAH
jgi:hypothetical protein